MYERGMLMLMTASSPLHPGASGGIGAIDLPVQRESSTGWPVVHAGGLKGAMRDRCGDDPMVKVLFGAENADHAGALGIAEARLLLFPVRSLKGVYAYVTCPLALARFRRDLEALRDVGHTAICDADLAAGLAVAGPQAVGQALVPSLEDSVLLVQRTANGQPVHEVVLEEIGLQVPHAALDDQPSMDNEKRLRRLALWLERSVPAVSDLSSRLLLVHDDMFTDFALYSTEVVTRNRINDATGIVEDGALWTEEHLPRETVLYASLFVARSLDPSNGCSALDVDGAFRSLMPDGRYFWVGGDTTVGKGLVTYRVL